jgi:NADPH-dependent ferric siderophore reductase
MKWETIKKLILNEPEDKEWPAIRQMIKQLPDEERGKMLLDQFDADEQQRIVELQESRSITLEEFYEMRDEQIKKGGI